MSSTMSFLLVILMASVTGQDYDQTQTVYDTVLDKSRYNTDMRPVLNQSQPIHVHVSFELLSIEEVNDISQSFVCNGILHLFWRDERATWNPIDHGGLAMIHPSPTKMWRPRLVLVNTLNKRDLFGDDYSPTRIESDGQTSWFPGSLFPTACKLDLRKYPFDQQNCHIQMLPMALGLDELEFIAHHADLSSYTVNGAWELSNSSLYTGVMKIKTKRLSYFQIDFKIRRRPTFFLLNILLPIVLLSFLNILVFIIPVESGEKISYGITVLLAMTVFLSIVSGMLPQSSDIIPSVTIYLLCLLIVSVLSVIDCIIIEFLQHLEVREERSIKARDTFQSAVTKINRMKNVVEPLRGNNIELMLAARTAGQENHRNGYLADVLREEGNQKRTKDDDDDEEEEDTRHNKYKAIGKHIDWVSFVVFIIIWVAITAWIFCEICL